MNPSLGRRRPPPSEAGFALIEVLISGVILVISATGIMALMSSTVHTAASQRNKSESYALAQEDQARLRGMAISSLKNFEQKRTVPVEGTTFTVESFGKFTNSTTGGDLSCASGGSSIDYVAVSSKVTWPNMSPTAATEIHSIIAPPNGSLSPTAGTLVFIAQNSTGGPLAAIGLSGTGAGTFTGSTNTSGCAIFLEQAAGEYTLTTTGYGTGVVDQDGNAPAAKKIKVSARATNTVNLLYDKPGSVPVKFRTTEYGGTTGALKAANNEYLIAYNTGMTTAKLFGEPGKKMSAETFKATSLFPFSSADVFYAGQCTSNAPGSGSAQASVIVPVNGTATPQTITLPAILPTIEKKETEGSGSKEKEVTKAFSGAKVKVVDTECEVSGVPVTREFTTNASGQIEKNELGLPWSTYEVCVSGSVTTGLKTAKNTKVRHISTTEPMLVHEQGQTTPLPPLTWTWTIEGSSAEGACP